MPLEANGGNADDGQIGNFYEFDRVKIVVLRRFDDQGFFQALTLYINEYFAVKPDIALYAIRPNGLRVTKQVVTARFRSAKE